MKTVGLIINPIAGLGGSVGLKGTDHVAQEALRRGAVPHAGERTCQALQALAQTAVPFQVVTWPGAMGGDAAQSLGLPCRLLPGVPQGESTRGEDTQALAKALAEEGVDLILFAGGDGTARDVYNALGLGTPVLGIPAGVKIHSPVFGRSPRDAGGWPPCGWSRRRAAPGRRRYWTSTRSSTARAASTPGCTAILPFPPSPASPRAGRPPPLSRCPGHPGHCFPGYRSHGAGGQPISLERAPPPGCDGGAGAANTLIGVDLVRDGKLIASDLSGLDIPALLEGRPTSWW